MSDSRRISFNIGASLVRMLATATFGLVGSRLLFSYLGEENFGTLTALGASGVFIVFFTMSLVRGLQREIAYNIGRKDWSRAGEVFSSSLLLFWILAVVLFITAMFFRSVIVGAMSLPAERIVVVEQVYLIAVAQIIVTIAMTPFRAVLEASQHLAAVSFVDTGLSALTLFVVWMLPSFSGDPLMLASLGQGCVLLVGALVVGGLSVKYCGPIVLTRLQLKLAHLKGVFSITGWSMFSHLSWILRNEGSVFALNVFFGPAINASYSLAVRLNAFQNELAFLVVRALQPPLTGAVASGDREKERSLTLLGSKIPVLASMFALVPILWCAEDIFFIWLGTVPEGAPLFLRILGFAMLGLASYGHQMALEARANLAGVTLWMTVPVIVTFAVVCLLHRTFDLPYWALVAGQVVVGLVLVFGVRPILHGAQLGIPVREWIRGVALPVGIVFVAGLVAAGPAFLFVQPGVIRVLAVTSSAAMGMLVTIWGVVLTGPERARLKVLLAKSEIIRRLPGGR